MTNKPSPGALDFARRHGLPEPRTRSEAVKQMRRILEPLGSASWRGSWRRHCGRRVELWTDADEARMDVIGTNGNDGLHYTGSTTNAEKVGYDSGDDNSEENDSE